MGIDQVNQAMAQIDRVTQQNAALVEEAAAAAESLQDQASQLVSSVVTFKLDESAADGAAAPAPAADTPASQAAKPAPAEPARPAAGRKERRAAPLEVLDWVKPVPRAHAAGGNGEWKEF
jgi:methyl-accepting chemotaxis protein